jgi:hypothetical protein
MSERRHESRFLCADLVKVEWLTGGENKILRTAEAVLEDISTLGACVQVEEYIPPGAPILVSVMGEDVARFSGHVSYCVFRDYGYFAGVRFSDETRWSSRDFEPQHLTSLEAMIM